MTREGSQAVWVAIMMGVFAVMWVFSGTTSLGGLKTICVVGAALVISVVIALMVVRRAKNIPADPDATPPNWRLYFGSVVFEIVAAGVGINLLFQFGQGRLWLPLLALIVGIHFFGTAAAFHHSLQFWVGAAMCLVALISLIWLPPEHPVGVDTVNVCELIVGIGCAVILWTYVLLGYQR